MNLRGMRQENRLLPDPPSAIPGSGVENSQFVFQRDVRYLLYSLPPPPPPLQKKKKKKRKNRLEISCFACWFGKTMQVGETSQQASSPHTSDFRSHTFSLYADDLSGLDQLPRFGGANRSERPPHYHADGCNCVLGPGCHA